MATTRTSALQVLPRLALAARRRTLLQWPLAAAGAAWANRLVAQPAATPGPAPNRLALVIGNRNYPVPHDLPSIHKNVRDVRDALQGRGFAVTTGFDLDVAQTRAALDTFTRQVQAAPADAVVFFYFSGHGVQVNADNLLLSAGVNPAAAPDSVVKGSMVLGNDVVLRVPRRPQGLTIAVVDACRTDLRAALSDGGGLNQVEAPPGCLIAFSTGAGKPALAPNTENQNTFYTGALVNLLNTASDELTFSDLFRLVKLETQRVMLNHPIPLIRQFTQYPFIAENTQTPVLLALRPTTPVVPDAPATAVAAPQAGASASAPVAAAVPDVAAAPRRFGSEDEQRDWAGLQAAAWPPEVLRLAEQFMQRYPSSKLAGGALVAREGAREAVAILRRADVRLYRSAFEPAAGSTPAYGTPPSSTPNDSPASGSTAAANAADLLKAARGDKDAAARVGRRSATQTTMGPGLSRYEGWLQYAAELGNGIASYDLALHYRRLNQPQPAARWEARSKELGYTPPPSLDNVRK